MCIRDSRSRVRLPDVFFMAEAYNDHMKTTPGDPCAALLEAGFNAVYDSDSVSYTHLPHT